MTETEEIQKCHHIRGLGKVYIWVLLRAEALLSFSRFSFPFFLLPQYFSIAYRPVWFSEAVTFWLRNIITSSHVRPKNGLDIKKALYINWHIRKFPRSYFICLRYCKVNESCTLLAPHSLDISYRGSNVLGGLEVKTGGTDDDVTNRFSKSRRW